MEKYCEYIRVSTKRQGNSGLGLSAQQEINRDFVKSVKGEIVATFKDVESGTHRDRPGLLSAVEYCKKNGTILLVAKLDRLARDVEFTFKIINTGIDIHFVDMPSINTIILGVFAAVAQYERELISKRTSEALRQRKAQIERDGGFISKAGNWCTSLGANNNSQIEGGVSNAKKRIQSSLNDELNKTLALALQNVNTSEEIRALSDKMNRIGIKTHTGLDFTPSRLSALKSKLKKRDTLAKKYNINGAYTLCVCADNIS